MLLTRRILPAIGVAALLLATLPGAGGAQEASSLPSSYSGTASAVAARISLTFKGFPITDVPVDGGGPTAQAVLDSLGSTNGYAAFPDPGSFLVGLPGLAVGLLNTGAAGLPSIRLPSIPAYPLAISTDGTNADQSLGSGPYELTSSSTPERSEATATAGLATPLGAVALLRSEASVKPDGSTIVAKAATTLEGLTIGPLSVGKIVSTATYKLDSSGTATPATDLRVSSIKVGGIAVDLTGDGIVAAGNNVPLSVGGVLSKLLAGAGITVKLLGAQSFPNKVVAPAVQITIPYSAGSTPLPLLGPVSGNLTLTLGAATAELSGTASSADVGGGTGDVGTSIDASGSGGADLGSVDPGATTDLPPLPAGAAVVNTPAGSGGPSQPLGDVVPALAAHLDVDLRTLYLVIGAGALAALALGHLIRRLGVRR